MCPLGRGIGERQLLESGTPTGTRDTGHETRDMGPDTGRDTGGDTRKSSLHWGWLSSGIACMAMFAAFLSWVPQQWGAAECGPPLLWRRPMAASIMVDGEAANIARQVILDESHSQ